MAGLFLGAQYWDVRVTTREIWSDDLSELVAVSLKIRAPDPGYDNELRLDVVEAQKLTRALGKSLGGSVTLPRKPPSSP